MHRCHLLLLCCLTATTVAGEAVLVEPVTLPAEHVAVSLIPGDVGAKTYPDLPTPFAIALADGAVVPGRAVVFAGDGGEEDAGSIVAGAISIAGRRFTVTYDASTGMIVGEGDAAVTVPFDAPVSRLDLAGDTGSYPVVVTHLRNHVCPVHDRGLMTWRSARAWRIRQETDVVVTIIDADGDGVIGDGDGIAPTDGPVYAPRRPIVGTGTGAWVIEAEETTVRTTPVAVTGSLALSWPAGTDDLVPYLAVVGETASAVLDVDHQEVRLPPGDYRLVYGLLLRDGRPVAGILPGDLPAVTVVADGTATMPLGPPFRLAGRVDDEGLQVVIPAESLYLIGRAGASFVGGTLEGEPEITLRAGDHLVATGTAEYG